MRPSTRGSREHLFTLVQAPPFLTFACDSDNIWIQPLNFPIVQDRKHTMAATLGDDALVRVSANGMLSLYTRDTPALAKNITAAESFTDAYYVALTSTRGSLPEYYVPKTVLPSGKLLPQISYNGTVVSDPDDFANTYTTQMPFAFFEVQSVNAHVLNPALAPLDNTAKPKEQEANMSILVQVSGYVRLIERKEGPMRAFSDTLVLVPNKEEAGAKGKGKTGEGKSWLIQNQNFRFVV
jgi:NTF2-related export protein 1/2